MKKLFRRYLGIYVLHKPALFIKDADLIKDISMTQFENFMDHSFLTQDDSDTIWGRNLFSLRGEQVFILFRVTFQYSGS